MWVPREARWMGSARTWRCRHLGTTKWDFWESHLGLQKSSRCSWLPGPLESLLKYLDCLGKMGEAGSFGLASLHSHTPLLLGGSSCSARPLYSSVPTSPLIPIFGCVRMRPRVTCLPKSRLLPVELVNATYTKTPWLWSRAILWETTKIPIKFWWEWQYFGFPREQW